MIPTTVSLFCGAGGESLGKDAAFRELGLSVEDMCSHALNHWDLAVAAHGINLPWVQVHQEDITAVTAATYGLDHIHLLWASPSCVHFSKARGGKPCEDQQRSHAWEVVDRWLRVAQVDVLLVENVPEFEDWGPLDDNGKAIKARKGENFRAFVQALRDLGYAVEWRVLCAADYGDPTTRRRFFLQAVRDGLGVRWPAPTHRDPKKAADLFAVPLPTWRTAAGCIDWTIPCPSIFTRKKPLADATLKRIAAGVVKYVLNGKPFIVKLSHGVEHGLGVQGIDDPIRTQTGRQDKAVVAPILTEFRGTSERHLQQSGASLSEPMKTITGGIHEALVCASLMSNNTNNAPHHPEEPLGTVTTGDRHYLVSSFLAKHYGGPNGQQTPGAPLSGPMPTVTAQDHNALVAASLMTIDQQSSGHAVSSLAAPVPTIVVKNRTALVAAFIQHYYGNGIGQNPDQPLHTITALARHGLVTVEIDGQTFVITDIGMRMLEPHELARAMGFPDWYRFEHADGRALSKRDQVKMIGNAVPCGLAQALVRAVVLARPAAFGMTQEAA